MSSHRRYVIDPDLVSVQADSGLEDERRQIPLPPLQTHPPYFNQIGPPRSLSQSTSGGRPSSQSNVIRNPLELDLPTTSDLSPLNYYRTKNGKSIMNAFPSSVATTLFLSLTHGAFPSKKAILDQWKLPFGLIARPFARQNRRSV